MKKTLYIVYLLAPVALALFGIYRQDSTMIVMGTVMSLQQGADTFALPWFKGWVKK